MKRKTGDSNSFLTPPQRKKFKPNPTQSPFNFSVLSSNNVPSILDASQNDNQVDPDAKSAAIARLLKEERQRVILTSRQRYDKEKLSVYQTFNSLRHVSERHRLKMGTPEIAVVGMQSDGKSSFVEALLGFRFNTVATEMGTRRPLIIQMLNDPAKESPECVFCDDEFRLYEQATPLDGLEKEIVRRTNEICSPTQVSAHPIMMRVRYRFCGNLTVFDFPGFRKAESDPLGPMIEKMVLEIVAKRNMIIVCLEQATVEWCNTQVRPIVQKADPLGKRTVFITTKFNNRINQFRNSGEVNAFMMKGLQIVEEAKSKEIDRNMFFLSMPSGRGLDNLSPQEYSQRKLETYLADYKQLLELGFDRGFKKAFGIYQVEEFLEKLLYRKYLQCIQPIEVQIQKAVFNLKNEINSLSMEIQRQIAIVGGNGGRKIVQFVQNKISSFCKTVGLAINGSSMFSMLSKFHMTLKKERELCGCTKWMKEKTHSTLEAADIVSLIPNAEMPLYGGAQIKRLIQEFSVVCHSVEFPKTIDAEVVACMGIGSFTGTFDVVKAASDLTRWKCMIVFKPLLAVLLKRSQFSMMCLLEMVSTHLKSDDNEANDGLFQTMRSVCNLFVEKLSEDVQEKLLEELEAFTKVVGLNFEKKGEKNEEESDEKLLKPTKEQTMERVKRMTQPKNFMDGSMNPEKEKSLFQKVKVVAAKMFAQIRFMFVQIIKVKFNRHFVEPVINDLDENLRNFFSDIEEDKLKDILFKGKKEKENEIKVLKEELMGVMKQFEMIKSLGSKLNNE